MGCYDISTFIQSVQTLGRFFELLYVDDAKFFGKNEKLVKKKKALFMAKWECWDLRDVKEFLHMRVTCTRSGISIDQCDYLEKILTRFQLTDKGSNYSTPNQLGTKGKYRKGNGSWDYSLPIHYWKPTVPNDWYTPWYCLCCNSFIAV